MSFNFRGKKKKDRFLFSFSSSSTDRKVFLWPLWAQANGGSSGEQAWGQQHYRKSWIILWEFSLFICNFKLYKLLKPLLSPRVTLPSRVDFFGTRLPRTTPEVPIELQAAPLRQERAKRAPGSSRRDWAVMHRSFPASPLGLFDSRVRGFVSPVVSREATQELKLQNF